MYSFEQFRSVSSSFEQFRAVSNSFEQFLTVSTSFGLTILRNTGPEIPWDKKAETLSEFLERLRDSGYSGIATQDSF